MSISYIWQGAWHMAKVFLITLFEPDYIGTRLLAAYLLKHGHSPHILHFKLKNERVFPEALEKHAGYQLCIEGIILRLGVDTNPVLEYEYKLLQSAIRQHKPDIVGISARTAHDSLMPRLVPVVREAAPKAMLVAGGFGATLNVEHYLNNGIDAVIRGDGEEALNDLANAIDNGEDWRSLDNFSYLESGQVQQNPVRAQRKDIDQFPAPLYGDDYCSWIDEKNYHPNEDFQWRKKFYNTLLGRGCVGKCTYCCAGQWYNQYREAGHTVFRRRNRSMNNVLNELEKVAPDMNFISFNDELFAAPSAYIKQFFEEYKVRINKPFFIYLSYAQMLKNDDLFNAVVNAGWMSTGIGMQSGSEKLCHDMYGRNYSNAEYIAYAKKLFDNDVYTSVHLIGGNPYETEEDFEQTLDVLREMPFSIIEPLKNHLYLVRLKPHPGTPLLSIAPKVLTAPVTVDQWLYRAALCNLRRIMNDDDFAEIRAQKFYHAHPDALLALYRHLASQLKLRYFTRLAEENEGKPMLFYGCGQIYLHNHQLFKGCKIQALLLDKCFIGDTTEINGLPVVDTARIKEYGDEMPVVIFSASGGMMRRNLHRNYGIDKSRIHVCPYPLEYSGRPITNYL